MLTILPRGIRLPVAILMAGLFAGVASAQTPAEASDPSTFDVGGVKLGMMPDEAMAALKAFDPALEITKKYLSGPSWGWGMEGSDLDSLYGADKDTAFLEDLVAIKGKPKQFCRGDMNCVDVYEEDQDTVTVWFSRTLGQQQAIMIKRQKSFNKEPKPSIESLKSGILAKYPEPQPTFESGRNGRYVLDWLFDARKQLLPGAAVKRKNIPFVESADGLPPSVRPGDGIALNAVFLPENSSSQLAGRFVLTLYDAGALFRSVKDAATTYQTLKAGVDAKQLERSKGAAATKF